jgi:hypothetical protein
VKIVIAVLISIFAYFILWDGGKTGDRARTVFWLGLALHISWYMVLELVQAFT